MRTALMVLAVLVLTACQTDSQVEWGEWEAIGPEQSLVAVSVPSGVNGRDIQRRRREDVNLYAVQESWRWSGGQAWLFRLPQNYAWRFEPNSPRVVTDEYEKWEWLKNAGVKIDRTDVQRSNNGIGNYFYAVADATNEDMFCFVAGQGLMPRVTPRYQNSPGSAGGIIQLYHCVPNGTASRQAVVDDMVKIMDSMALR